MYWKHSISLAILLFVLCSIAAAGNIPNDTYFESKQWNLWNTDQNTGTPGADICWLPASWITTGSSDIRIMVADYGIAITEDGVLCNPDLDDTSRILLGSNLTSTCGSLPRECTSHSFCSHGTSVAGLAAAEMNDNEGITGVCPECELYVVRLWDEGSRDSNTFITIMQEAFNNDIDAMTVGAYPNELEMVDFTKWLDSLDNNGTFVVITGDAEINAMAGGGSHHNLITVGYSGYDDQLITTSSYSHKDSIRTITCPNAGWTTLNGCDTAGACGAGIPDWGIAVSSECNAVPQVAGVIGLLKTLHQDTLTTAQIKSILTNSADKVWQWPEWPAYDEDWADSSWHPGYGNGRMNAFRVLTYYEEGIAGYIRKDSTLSGTVTVFGDLLIGEGAYVTLSSGMNFSFDSGDMYQSVLGEDTATSEIILDGGFVYDAATGGIAGHITSNTTWSDTVLILGDVIIDAGVTVTVDTGTVFIFDELSLFQSPLGDYADSSELISSICGLDYLDPPCGDANGDGSINVGDVVYLQNYVFNNGPAPDPLSSGEVNGDGSVNLGDVIYLNNHVWCNGLPPRCFYW